MRFSQPVWRIPATCTHTRTQTHVRACVQPTTKSEWRSQVHSGRVQRIQVQVMAWRSSPIESRVKSTTYSQIQHNFMGGKEYWNAL